MPCLIAFLRDSVALRESGPFYSNTKVHKHRPHNCLFQRGGVFYLEFLLVLNKSIHKITDPEFHGRLPTSSSLIISKAKEIAG